MTKATYADLGDMLEELKGNYKVLLFPCNQFLGQEPGKPTGESVRRLSVGKIKDVTAEAGVYLMEKVDVNGEGASPVFQFLRYNSKLYDEGSNLMTPIPWNFAKFLVDPSGGVLGYYGPKTKLADLKGDLETSMKGSAPAAKPRRASVKMQQAS